MVFDIITFGSAVVDMFVGTDVAEQNRKISYPVGSKILIKDFREDIGGGATNTAVAFSRLGLRTGCICKIGDDTHGKNILRLLKKEKVKFLGAVEKNSKTDFSVILDSRQHGRTILTNKKISNKIDFSDLNMRKMKTRWLYLASSMGMSFRTQKKLAAELHKKGVKIAFNPTEYLIKNENIPQLLKICDVLILNREEAELLVGKKKDLLGGLRELGPKIVVMTDRNKRIECYNGIKKYFLKPNKVKVVERTGAGDAFASGFVAGLIADRPIEESLNLGLRESEAVIRHFGAKNNLIKMKLRKK